MGPAERVQDRVGDDQPERVVRVVFAEELGFGPPPVMPAEAGMQDFRPRLKKKLLF